MEHMWAPWRIDFIESKKAAGCVFCQKPAEDNDEANYILFRGQHNFIILNAYPYNPGHLLVVPFLHLATLNEMTDEARYEHIDLVCRGIDVLKQALGPDGFNTGMNLGQTAGAGIADHIHSHIVPRWQGDSNFMTTVADIRVLPQALSDSYQKLKGFF